MTKIRGCGIYQIKWYVAQEYRIIGNVGSITCLLMTDGSFNKSPVPPFTKGGNSGESPFLKGDPPAIAWQTVQLICRHAWQPARHCPR
ncbi:MAG: hypothetical protein KAU38_10605, partial [Desulfobacterales bacterium]|nr:hypothetical protein [Desulfobacterales bacterium]